MDTLWHLAEANVWSDALRTGLYTGSTKGASLAEVSFVHCSFAAQLPIVAAAIYRGMSELMLLEIDPGRLGMVDVRVEAVPGTSERFPHVYGAIPTAAVTSVTPVRVDSGGRVLNRD